MRNNLLLIFFNEQDDGTIANLQQSYNVFLAHSLADVYGVLANVAVQLIICNIDRAGGQGRQLCTRFKSSPTWSHIPVILTSAEDTLSARIKSLEAGADVHIGMPVPWKYFDLQLKNLVLNRRRMASHFSYGSPAAGAPAAAPSETHFIEQLKERVVSRLHDPALSVDQLARLMNMSRPTLYRRIKTITDLTPNELITQVRLQQAARLLESGHYKVFEIAKMVGFYTQSSFGKAFIKQFKKTPTQYLQVKKQLCMENAVGRQNNLFLV
jgi:AraC-like DNA-binding protein